MSEKNHYTELPNKEDNDLILRCPNCHADSTFRRDAIAIGLHWLMCKNFGKCRFATDKIKLVTGELVGKMNRDYV